METTDNNQNGNEFFDKEAPKYPECAADPNGIPAEASGVYAGPNPNGMAYAGPNPNGMAYAGPNPAGMLMAYAGPKIPQPSMAQMMAVYAGPTAPPAQSMMMVYAGPAQMPGVPIGRMAVTGTDNAGSKKEFKFCMECGAKNKRTNKFCVDCGAKFPPEVQKV